MERRHLKEKFKSLLSKVFVKNARRILYVSRDVKHYFYVYMKTFLS